MSRIENDFLGSLEIPDDVYYGVQTMRGKQNFHITEMPMSQEPFFAIAFAYVKKAAALTNKELGTIPADVADALVWACDQLIAGKYNDQFVTDWLQGGAGTSTNMNANEVIANRALEIMGKNKGEYTIVSPNDHINKCQSTNDTYPTALHLSLILRSNVLVKAVEDLVASFYKQAEKTKDVLKMGRTHLQDAVPMSFAQEFHGWGTTIGDEIKTIREAQEHLKVVNLGATAIGTTVTCHPEYPAKAVKRLAELTGIPFVNSDDLIAATSDCGAYVALSSACKSLAVKLTKVCNDLRLLASGPRTGLGEIVLPQLQPGSSIMPGKVNPVIPEVTNQAAFLAIGLDTSVMLAASAGQLELNVMEPVISFALYMQMKVLTNSCNALREKCIDGIVVNAKHCEDLVMGSLGIITVLKPHFGYKPCANIAREGFLTGKSLHELIVDEKKMLTQEQWDKVFTHDNLINPKFEQ